jgi:hypothetical protein
MFISPSLFSIIFFAGGAKRTIPVPESGTKRRRSRLPREFTDMNFGAPSFGYSNAAMVKMLTDNQASLGASLAAFCQAQPGPHGKEHTQKLDRERNEAKESHARAQLELTLAQSELEAFKKKEELNVRLQTSLQETQMLRMKVVEFTCRLCLSDPSCTAEPCGTIKARAARAAKQAA